MTNEISVHTKFEVGWVISFPDDCGKPSFSVIFFPLRGQNWANMAPNRTTSKDSPNECLH